MIHKADSLEKIHQFACDFVEKLQTSSEATVIGLKGDLGSGKTTFVQHLASCLGVEERLTSPTFTIQKTYKLDGKYGFTQLVHIDAYRLELGEELTKLGFQDLLQNKNNLILIEWPSNVSEILPENIKYLEFVFIDEITREIIYEE